MKIRNLLIIAIICAILIGTLFLVLLNEETYEYYNEEVGFKISIPKTWEKTEIESDIYAGGVFLEYPVNNEDHDLSIVIQLMNKLFPTYEGTLNDVVNDTIAKYANATDYNFSIVSNKSIEINGVKAHEFIIEGKYDDSEYQTMGRLINLIHNKKYFHILVHCTPKSLYEEHESDINHIINSFEIN